MRDLEQFAELKYNSRAAQGGEAHLPLGYVLQDEHITAILLLIRWLFLCSEGVCEGVKEPSIDDEMTEGSINSA